MSNIEIIRGDDVTLNATFKDENGDPIDITGYTVFFTVKDNYTSTTDDDALIVKTISTHANPTAGYTEIYLNETNTDLEEGDYYFDFQLKDTDAKIASTKRGVFSVVYDVTRRTA